MHRVTKAMLQEKIKHVNQIRWGHDGTEWPMPKGTFHLDWAYNKPAVFVATRSDSHGGGRMVIPRGTKTEVARGLDILVHGLTIGNCGLSALENSRDGNWLLRHLKGAIKPKDKETETMTERSIGETWEQAESLGWVNPIDTLFDKYGVDNCEDLPEHEQAGYTSAVDEAEGDAIDYIESHRQGRKDIMSTARVEELMRNLIVAEVQAVNRIEDIERLRIPQISLGGTVLRSYLDAEMTEIEDLKDLIAECRLQHRRLEQL